VAALKASHSWIFSGYHNIMEIEDIGKKPQILNPSNFGLIPLHITGFLILVIFSMYLESTVFNI